VDQGFSQISFWKKTSLISEFSRWLNDKKITLEKITAEHERDRGQFLMSV
jgi:hypothetical protein